MPLLEHSLDSVDAYIRFFAAQPIPVLRRTANELDALRENANSVSGKRISAVVLGDPLMTLKLLSHMQMSRGERQNHDITTIDRAIMMIGVSSFFDTFTELPTLEEVLGKHPRALLGVLKVIGRARRAAHFARDWAVVRHDLDVEEITLAALLREAAEIMCWTFAPHLAQQVFDLQEQDRHLRSVVAQTAVFSCSFHAIQLALAQAWRLPELLVQLMDPNLAENPRVRTVLLADDLTRHLTHGWEDPALPDDIDAIQKLLRIPRRQLLSRIRMPDEVQENFLGEED